jgi:hypothetical protein
MSVYIFLLYQQLANETQFERNIKPIDHGPAPLASKIQLQFGRKLLFLYGTFTLIHSEYRICWSIRLATRPS